MIAFISLVHYCYVPEQLYVSSRTDWTCSTKDHGNFETNNWMLYDGVGKNSNMVYLELVC